MFRYLSLTSLCDATFVVFLVSWLFTRQVGLVFVLQTIYRHSPKFIHDEWNPAKGHYYNSLIINLFLALLSLLLCLTTVWFYMACMVAVRVVRGLGAEDSRSDDEDEGSPTLSPTPAELEQVPQVHSTGTGDGLANGHGAGEVKKRR